MSPQRDVTVLARRGLSADRLPARLAGRPAHPPAALQTTIDDRQQTTDADRRQRAKQYRLIRWASNNTAKLYV